jgi:tetratricopeptide (TPR) repeat protein
MRAPLLQESQESPERQGVVRSLQNSVAGAKVATVHGDRIARSAYSLVLLLALLWATVFLQAQSQEMWDSCESDDARRSITACSLLIESGTAKDGELEAAYIRRGLSHANQHEYDEAILDFDEALKLNPADVLTLCHRGLAYCGKGNVDRAIGDYDRALQVKPDYAYAFLLRGSAYIRKGDYKRSISDLNEALR